MTTEVVVGAFAVSPSFVVWNAVDVSSAIVDVVVSAVVSASDFVVSIFGSVVDVHAAVVVVVLPAIASVTSPAVVSKTAVVVGSSSELLTHCIPLSN